MKVRLPKPEGSRCRAFVACVECGRATYYDYVPFGLSSPVATLPCGHGIMCRLSDATRSITEKQFRAYWAEKPEGYAVR